MGLNLEKLDEELTTAIARKNKSMVNKARQYRGFGMMKALNRERVYVCLWNDLDGTWNAEIGNGKTAEKEPTPEDALEAALKLWEQGENS